MFFRRVSFIFLPRDLSWQCTAGGERLAAAQARGGHLHWSLRCSFRRSVVDAGGTAASPVVSWAAPSGSLTAWWMCASPRSGVLGSWYEWFGLTPNSATFDVEAAWFNAFDAVLPCAHLTFRCGSSLMLSTCALTHTMWSGCSILYPLALGLRTCLPESKHMLVTVCFRFASWTGLFQVVTRAFYLFSHVSFHHVVMMSERSRCVQPTCNASYTQFLNPL